MSDFNTDPSTRSAASVRRKTICMLRGARLQRRSVRLLFRGGGRYFSAELPPPEQLSMCSLVSDQVEMVKAPLLRKRISQIRAHDHAHRKVLVQMIGVGLNIRKTDKVIGEPEGCDSLICRFWTPVRNS